MKKVYYLICCSLICLSLQAQTSKIIGRVTDDKGEGLIQVNVMIDVTKGIATVTDYDGNYELAVAPGTYDVTYRYIGKEETKVKITLAEGEKKTQNLVMKDKARMMDQVVVSGSKYEKKLSEETVSMDVMKGSTMNNQNVTDLQNGVQKIPGVTIADGQANIRGGSGWSYGAGSRVAVLYDGLPVTTADADDAKWSMIPMENIEQVEVIKGAASALYGSGALNGIINAITAWPTDKPYTKVQTYGGFYGNPKEGDMKWWGKGQPQYFSGFNIADRRKIGQFDLITGAGFTTDRGYLDSSDSHDFHINAKLRWRSKKIQGLNMGINAVAYYSWGKIFFVWDSIGSKGYEPLAGTITNYHNGRYIVDPFINYYDKKDNKFTFKYRYLNSTNINTTGQGSIGHKNYAEFQYAKMMKKYDLNIVAGAVGMYDIAKSPASDTLSLIGNHNRANMAIYVQVDKRFFKKLNTTIGARWEFFSVDTGLAGNKGRKNSLQDLAYPLARIGLNYQAAKATFIRASAGMAFRYPSLAEMYVQTHIGPIGVYSNPNLKPEKGYSAEVGLKQGFKFGKNWTGYADAAFFLNQYNNMMEFSFGQFGGKNAPLFGLGFASQNIGNARILGTEILGAVNGKIGQVELNFVAGYTFIDAHALDWNKRLILTNQDGDTVLPYVKLFGPTGGIKTANYANIDPKTNDPNNPYLTYAMTSSANNNVLKYRPKHQFKFIMGIGWKKWDLSADYQYLSYQENIDYAFVSDLFVHYPGLGAFAGLKNYRDQKAATGNKGDHVLNLSVGFKPMEKLKLAVIIKNVTNTEWMPRPARLEAPRNYTLQIGYTF